MRDGHCVTGVRRRVRFNAYAILEPCAASALHLPFFNYLSQTPRLYYMAYRCSYGVAAEKMFFRLDWFLKERIRHSRRRS